MTFREEQFFDMTPKRTPKINFTKLRRLILRHAVYIVTPA
jgi:hypothetical protein